MFYECQSTLATFCILELNFYCLVYIHLRGTILSSNVKPDEIVLRYVCVCVFLNFGSGVGSICLDQLRGAELG